MGAGHIVQGWFTLDKDLTAHEDGTLTVAPAAGEALPQVLDQFVSALVRTPLLAAAGSATEVAPLGCLAWAAPPPQCPHSSPGTTRVPPMAPSQAAEGLGVRTKVSRSTAIRPKVGA